MMQSDNQLISKALPSLLLKGQGDFARTDAARALEQEDYTAALRELDDRLVSDPHSLVDRLWWVRCQYELQSLPITALSAPLEEMFTNVRERPELGALAVATYMLVGQRLRERSYSKLGAVIGEKAVELCQQSNSSSQALTIPESLQRAALTAYKQILEEELERSKKRGEGKVYLQSIETKIAGLRTFEAELDQLAKLSSKRVDPRTPLYLTAKALRAQASADEDLPESTWQLGEKPARRLHERPHEWQKGSQGGERRDETATEQPTKAPGLSGTENIRSVSRQQVVLVAILLTLGIAFYYRGQILGPSAEEIDARLAMRPLGAEMLFRLNELTPRMPGDESGDVGSGGAGDSSNTGIKTSSFDRLSNRLEKLAEEAKKVDSPRSNPAGELNDQLSGEMNASSSTSPPPVVASLPAASTLDPKKAPLLDPQELKGTTVEQMGGDSRVTMAPPAVTGIEQGRDGQLYGPPVSVDGGRTGGAAADPYAKPGTALDGSAIRSYAVERFPTPLTFKTITATNVVDAPSVLAPAIDRLQSDAVVKVVARMGKWLELQSTGGRRGFIYAQDAVEVKN